MSTGFGRETRYPQAARGWYRAAPGQGVGVNPYRAVYEKLHSAYGPQHWWPADTPFEVMVGAILTQNTAWRNVEQAIANLRSSGRFDPGHLKDLPASRLAELIRPAGCHNVKSRRLQAFLSFILSNYGGSVARMRSQGPVHTRGALLGVHGIGPETADCILLYALGHPAFVVDAYTRRIFVRLGLVDDNVKYDALQTRFVEALPEDAALFNEYHALIVALGKDVCRPKPLCGSCPLLDICPSGKQNVSGAERNSN